MSKTIPDALWPSKERMTLMKAGIRDLSVWLDDIIRVGLMMHQLPESELDTMAARLVDSQLGGLARKLRLLKTLDRNGMDWPERVLGILSKLYLATDSFQKWELLNPLQQFTLLMFCGLQVRKEQIKDLPGTKDFWTVIGVHFLPEENLIMRRVWLSGAGSKKIGMLLDFKHRTGNFNSFWEINQTFAGELVFYPSTFPLRAILKNFSSTKLERKPFPSYNCLEKFMDRYALAVSKDNWLSVFPAPLKDVYLDFIDGAFRIIDKQKKWLSVSMDENNCWSLTGRSYSRPLECFAEWDGRALNIISYRPQGNMFIPVHELENS